GGGWGGFRGGKDAREGDGQCVGTERTPQRGDRGRRFVPALRLHHRATTRHGDQLRPQCLVRLPELAVVNVVNRIPEPRVATKRQPVGAEVAVVQLFHLR